LETPATGNTGQNCVEQSQPFKARRVTHHHPEERVLLRLDGQYGTGADLADLAGLPFVMRGKDDQLLKRAEVQARLKLPPDQQLTHPRSAGWCVTSTIALICLWDQRECGVGS
jgi:hypothetical protein